MTGAPGPVSRVTFARLDGSTIESRMEGTVPILFLDLDGVLRRSASPLYALDRELVANLEDVLRRAPGVEVVITSSWREAFSLAELRKHFSADIWPRIVGVTPLSQSKEGFYRHREVLAYLKAKGMASDSWVAVDDDPEHYPRAAPVLLVDPAVGLDRAAASELARRLGG